jgi:hypothetical protein
MTLFVLLWFVLAITTGGAARSRGRSGLGWFLLALVISPLLALLVLAAAGTKTTQQDGPTKTCQFCQSKVHADALVCPHCQRDIDTSAAVALMQERRRSAKATERMGLTILALVVLVAVFLLSKPSEQARTTTAVSAEKTRSADPVRQAGSESIEEANAA